jgi:carotenoid cleavage dioxygenase
MIAVIPRNAKSDKDVVWIQSPPFFQFHTMNAFEAGNQIELSFPWYDSYSLTHPSSRLELHRLVIDLQKRSVGDQALDDQACEFSRINDAYIGRKARYGYVGLRDPRPGEKPQIGAFEAMARYDLASGKKIVHQFPAGSTICEPLFVADPHGKSEEDVFILQFRASTGGAGRKLRRSRCTPSLRKTAGNGSSAKKGSCWSPRLVDTCLSPHVRSSLFRRLARS